MLNILIFFGSNLNVRDYCSPNRTPIQVAIGRGSVDCVQALLAADVKVVIPADDSWLLSALVEYPKIKALLNIQED